MQKCHFLSCSDHLSKNNNSKTAQILTLILARNWCPSQRAASQLLSTFIAPNLPWSIKPIHNTLCGGCPLWRTPFSNFACTPVLSYLPEPSSPRTTKGLGTKLPSLLHVLTLVHAVVVERSNKCRGIWWVATNCEWIATIIIAAFLSFVWSGIASFPASSHQEQ